MGEGTVFSLFVSPHHDGGGGGGYPGQVWDGGGGVLPQLDLDGGVPRPVLDGGGGVYPSQVMVGGVPRPGLDGGGGGFPGYPRPSLDGGGYLGYPPTMSGWGYPPPPTIASTCYAAGGMPLAFTQEDFLV